MPESREPDAVQVEAPDNHLGYTLREDGGWGEEGEEEGEEEEWVAEDMDRSNDPISNNEGRASVIMSARWSNITAHYTLGGPKAAIVVNSFPLWK
jgi:hypothetical protein